MTLTPEGQAREAIDAALTRAGWLLQDRNAVNLSAGPGVAVREVVLQHGSGTADYMLFIHGKAAGAIEAKKQGEPLTGSETQAYRYSDGLPALWAAHARPLPFLYQSTGAETVFTCLADPKPVSRRVYSFHRPETLAGWLETPTLRARLQAYPPLQAPALWPIQVEAVTGLERSLAMNRPRALIQMATGSGKTFTAITAIYRLVRYGKAEKVLFLVDRGNLGRQALKEFQQFDTPDDGRKFTELYNVQLLSSAGIDPAAKVVICTIQRLYSILKGEPLEDEADEGSQFEGSSLFRDPPPVEYTAGIPPEFFDFIFIDECHRSIFQLWRQVLEYFDAFLIGLTATPDKRAFAFFDTNLVVEYNHELAVADHVNVDFDIYSIRTRITEQGAKLEASEYAQVGRRSRNTRQLRWEQLEDDLTYTAAQLDRDVVAVDQIRTIIKTFKDKLFTEIFPGRREVPKTLIFAKDDSHADDIVQAVREVFGEGNDFCQKITYRTSTARIVEQQEQPDGSSKEVVTYKSSGLKPEDLLSAFRNSFYPRIVVTVDMIATGTDVKPLEIVMFMRTVKSRTYFEQMKGRGVRICNPTEMAQATPDAGGEKTRFVIVDCVGVCEDEKMESAPLDSKRNVAFEKLLDAVAYGSTDDQVISSLASRLIRLDKKLDTAERESLEQAAGLPMAQIAANMLHALDPDLHIEAARAELPEGAEPSAAQVAAKAEELKRKAAEPLASNPQLRSQLVLVKQRADQIVDATSLDEVIEAGISDMSRDKARETVQSFRLFIEQHRDELTALRILYSKPYPMRLHFADIKALAASIKAPPHSWDTNQLWRAFEVLDRSRVRGAGAKRLLTDLVQLVRFTLEQDERLIPFNEHVEGRYAAWLAEQEDQGRSFSDEQREWLQLIRDFVASSAEISPDDFELSPFVQHGGYGRAQQLFGPELPKLLEELSEVLVA